MSAPRMVKVKSARELKPGTWLYIWSVDGGCYWVLLLRKYAEGISVNTSGFADPKPSPGWVVIGEPRNGRVCHRSLLRGIRAGKIWRVVGGGSHARQLSGYALARA